MSSTNNEEKHLPLTEATYYIMLTLVEPKHGYAMMQEIRDLTAGSLKIGPGTIYGVLLNLEKEKLIEKVSESNRRKSYVLTQKGRRVLLLQLERLGKMIRNGADYFNRLSEHGNSQSK